MPVFFPRLSFCGFVSDILPPFPHSSFLLLLFRVSCLCLFSDPLCHSQHISVAAIKIAQKIIINIVGYNKRQKKKEIVQIYIYCTAYFAFHISHFSPRNECRLFSMLVDDICQQEWGFVRYARVYVYLRSICVYFVVKSWTGDTKTASTGAEQLRLDDTLYAVRSCANSKIIQRDESYNVWYSQLNW